MMDVVPTPNPDPRSGRSMKRSFRRPVPPLVESADDPDAPARNAWPAGTRVMRCLSCDAQFSSSGRHERMCPSCRRHTP